MLPSLFTSVGEFSNHILSLERKFSVWFLKQCCLVIGFRTLRCILKYFTGQFSIPELNIFGSLSSVLSSRPPWWFFVFSVLIHIFTYSFSFASLLMTNLSGVKTRRFSRPRRQKWRLMSNQFTRSKLTRGFVTENARLVAFFDVFGSDRWMMLNFWKALMFELF